jgi:hypothetical protein
MNAGSRHNFSSLVQVETLLRLETMAGFLGMHCTFSRKKGDKPQHIFRSFSFLGPTLRITEC